MTAPVRFEPAISAEEAAHRLGRFEDAVARLPDKSREARL